ncbi:MAG: AIDA repeat-containing protein, partial [Methylophilus sp.]|uniref:AIDA repeat-containing protein n=1 Tax=Methylophilus sp. TaxID=29541 RepID=UPI004036BA6A
MALLCLAGQQAQAADSIVPAGGSSDGAVIDNGDIQDVYGTATNTKVLGLRAAVGGVPGVASTQFVYAKGIAEGTVVGKDGTQLIRADGTAKNTTVQAGGSFDVKANGTVENLTVKSGGAAYLEADSIWKGTINYEPGSNSGAAAKLTTTWKMTGDSAHNILRLGNNGHIDFEAPGSVFKAKTLSIDELVGQGGLITLNQVLGDGSVAGDKIIIRNGGKVSGTTYLAIRNAGGLGGKTGGDGMLVVEAQANADTTAQSSKDGFKLKQPVYAGAYEYKLRAGDAKGFGQNWYLSSESTSSQSLSSGSTARPAYRPASAALPALMDLSGRMALHALLHGPQAVGTALDTSAETTTRHPMWLFASQERLHAGGNGDINPAYSSWISGLHLGSDLWRNEESTT